MHLSVQKSFQLCGARFPALKYAHIVKGTHTKYTYWSRCTHTTHTHAAPNTQIICSYFHNLIIKEQPVTMAFDYGDVMTPIWSTAKEESEYHTHTHTHTHHTHTPEVPSLLTLHSAPQQLSSRTFYLHSLPLRTKRIKRQLTIFAHHNSRLTVLNNLSSHGNTTL